MLTQPNAARMPGNFTMLEDYVQSSEEICRLLVGHLECADTLAPEDLPLEVPLLLCSLVKECTCIRVLSRDRSNMSGKSMCWNERSRSWCFKVSCVIKVRAVVSSYLCSFCCVLLPHVWGK